MHRDVAINILRAHAAELRAAGVEHVSIFGSVARGQAGPQSDVDIVVRLSPEAKRGGFAYFGRLADLKRHFERILGCSVDLVVEPVQREALREVVEREAALAF
jgi:uncharacterized protein